MFRDHLSRKMPGKKRIPRIRISKYEYPKLWADFYRDPEFGMEISLSKIGLMI